jgi:hypothetical protein
MQAVVNTLSRASFNRIRILRHSDSESPGLPQSISIRSSLPTKTCGDPLRPHPSNCRLALVFASTPRPDGRSASSQDAPIWRPPHPKKLSQRRLDRGVRKGGLPGGGHSATSSPPPCPGLKDPPKPPPSHEPCEPRRLFWDPPSSGERAACGLLQRPGCESWS